MDSTSFYTPTKGKSSKNSKNKNNQDTIITEAPDSSLTAINDEAEDVFFIGNSGKVQVYINKSTNPVPRIAVILPNDPMQHLGSIKHPIVELMANEFIKQDFTVIRMNFKGVDKSDGKFEGGHQELVNATLLIDWILNNYYGKDLWMCGFSYGAWAAMQIMMRRPEVTKFLVVAPPCNKYDFSFLSPCPVSGLIVHGTIDTITPINALKELTSKSSKQKKYSITVKYIEQADHFFREKRAELAETIGQYIKTNIEEEDAEEQEESNTLSL